MKSRVYIYTIKLCAIAFFSILITNNIKAQHADDEFWSSGFTVPGVFSSTYAYVDDLVETPYGVFITGYFSSIDGVAANSIAFWNNGTWEALGEGLRYEDTSPAEGYALHLDGENLYVVGEFETAGDEPASNIAIWNIVDEEWTSLPGNFSNQINTVVTVGSNVYVGGDFTSIDEASYNHIAVWDGEGWNSFQGGVNGEVNVLKRNGGQLYVGGDFTAANEVPVSNLAIWTGSEWNNFGGGSDGDIYDIHFVGDSVIVGGSFSQLNGIDFNYLGIWTDEAWSSFPVEPNNTVYDIEGTASELVIAGYFTQIGILETSGFAIWNGSSWDIPANELNTFESLYSATNFDGNWIVGGYFNSVDELLLNNIASLTNDLNWERFGTQETFKGVSGNLQSIEQDGADYYVGGSFTGIGSSSISRFAKWNGSTWESFGEEPNGTVNDILVDGDLVYVAGSFTSIGGIEANRIAVWNKSTEQWSALKEGTSSSILTLLKVGNNIYAGGNFNDADGSEVNKIAVWDGENWNSLGNGVNGSVRAMVEFDGKLFVGGSFNEAGLVIASHIASWNGSVWENLGDGVDGSVYALATTDSSVIIGGEFEHSADGEASNIVEWVPGNGKWNTFGKGLDDRVQALHIYDDKLYAGGEFTKENFKGVIIGLKVPPLNGISVWGDSLKWEPFGSGIKRASTTTSHVYDIETIGDELFVGGRFDLAGGKISSGIAVWDLTETLVSNEDEYGDFKRISLNQNYPNPFNPSTNISFELRETGLVTLSVFNILGQEVAVLVNGKLTSGTHTLIFNASHLPSGVYIYQLNTPSKSISRKMLLIK
ncbi:MAG: T9SS type A sorting domain-containing protein [Balneolaceae bacterium]